MRHPSSTLPPLVTRTLRRYGATRNALAWLRAAASAVAAGTAAALVAMGLDLLFFLSVPVRLGLSLSVAAAAAAGFLIEAVRTLRRPFDLRRAAYALEEAAGGDAVERLVTAAQVLSEREEAGSSVRSHLKARLAALAKQRAAELSPFRLARDALLFRRFVEVAVLLIFVGMASAYVGRERADLLFRRLLAPKSALPKAGFLRLVVEPETMRLGAGSEVLIQARVEGEVPRWIVPLVRWTGHDPDQCHLERVAGRPARWPANREVFSMQRVGRELFVVALSDVRESFSFRVRCGDSESEVRFAEVVPRPRLLNVRAIGTPPPYTGLPSETFERLDVPLTVFPGTLLEIRGAIDPPEARVRLSGPTNKPLPLAQGEEGEWWVRWEVQEALFLELSAVQADGIESAERLRIAIGLREDQPPTVTLLEPTQDPVCMPGEILLFRAEAEDDLGIADATLEVLINPERTLDAPLHELPMGMEIKGRKGLAIQSVDLAAFRVQPGDEVLMTVRVRDTGARDGRSRSVRVRIAAVTAGENERRRLAVLEAVERMVRGLSREGAEGWSVETEVQEDAARRAARAGVDVRAVRDGAGLVALLEQEVHFTDGHRDKEDLRRLAGVLRNMLFPVFPEGGAPPMAEWLEAVSRLTRYRQARLAALRFFGLIRETAALTDATFDAEEKRPEAEVLGAVAARLLEHPQLAREAEGVRQLRDASRRINASIQQAEKAMEERVTLGGPFEEAEALAARLTAWNEEAADLSARLVKGEEELNRRAAGFGREVASAVLSDLKNQPGRPETFEEVGGELGVALGRWLSRAERWPEPEEVGAMIRDVMDRHSREGKSGEAENRRLVHLFETMEETADAVLAISQHSGGSDFEAAAAIREALSLAIRSLRRESVPQPRTVEAVVKQLHAFQGILDGVLPALWEEAERGRTELIGWDRALRDRLRAATGVWEEVFGREWLLADRRMLEWIPCASFADRLEWLTYVEPSLETRRLISEWEKSDPAAADRRNGERLALEMDGEGEGVGLTRIEESVFWRHWGRFARSEGADEGRFEEVDLRSLWPVCAALPCGRRGREAVREAVQRLEEGGQTLPEAVGRLRLEMERLLAVNEIWAAVAPDEESAQTLSFLSAMRRVWARYDVRAEDGGMEEAARGLKRALLRAAEESPLEGQGEGEGVAMRICRLAGWVRRIEQEGDSVEWREAVRIRVEQDEAFAWRVLLRERIRLEEADAALEEAARLLEEPKEGLQGVEAAFRRAAGAWERFEGRVSRLAASVVERALAGEERIDARILGAIPRAGSRDERQRSAMELVEAAAGVRRVRARLDRLEVEGESGEWGGGFAPQGEEWERDEDHARRRLSRQMGQWEARAVVALMSEWEGEEGKAEGTGRAEARSRLDAALRVAVSSLGQGVGERVRRGPVELRATDPLLRWLLEELGEARQMLRRETAAGPYQQVTEQYLRAVEGFLRY